jgi:hypothetical protein
VTWPPDAPFVEPTINGARGDTEDRRHLVYGLPWVEEHFVERGPLQIGELGLPTGLDALCARADEAGVDPLMSGVASELRERCDDVELGHSARRRCVDRFGQALDLDATLAKRIEQADNAGERVAEAIEFPNEECVTVSKLSMKRGQPGRPIPAPEISS